MRKWNDDPFTKKARRENYEARSVYKLQEIQKRDRILDGAKTILDLGAAPGSWIQFCLETLPSAMIFAIDLTPITLKHERLKFLHGDILTANIPELIAPNTAIDVVLSDMAPKTTGIRSIDVEKSAELVHAALLVSVKILRQGGNLVVKLFMGDTLKNIEGEFKKRFETVRLFRPEATRKHSMEIFVIGKGKN